MHLRDYTYGELAGALKRAGIGTIASVVRLPSEATVFGMRFQPKASVAYLAYLRTMERFIGALATQAARRTMSRAAKLILFRSGITIVVGKPSSPERQRSRPRLCL